MAKHTPGPWSTTTTTHIIGSGLIVASVQTGLDTAIQQANAKRIVECVNACEGQSIENVKLATAHRDACMQWETTMMRLVGEDGIGSVETAITQLKDQNARLKDALEGLLDSFGHETPGGYTNRQIDAVNDAQEVLSELRLAQKGGQDEAH